MRVHSYRPGPAILADHLQKQKNKAFSYPAVGASTGAFPEGYQHNHYRFKLGQDEEVWERAKKAIRNWEMFNNGWAFVYPDKAPIEPNQAVVVCFRLFGLWWKNSCRIVYTIDKADQFGFAYGTLPDHVAKGEEYFGVERDSDQQVWFIIKAFSQPVFWGARFFRPLLRDGQRRFVQQAGARIQALTRADKHPLV